VLRCNRLEQQVVGGSPHVTGPIRLYRSTDDKKVLCFCDFCWQRGTLRLRLNRGV
jgi:hypothetical protein